MRFRRVKRNEDSRYGMAVTYIIIYKMELDWGDEIPFIRVGERRQIGIELLR